jgi:hypothetical protein
VDSPVFKTGGRAPCVGRWVRLPCTPATAGLSQRLGDARSRYVAWVYGATLQALAFATVSVPTGSPFRSVKDNRHDVAWDGRSPVISKA